MAFAYYDRLSRTDQKIYRSSDRLPNVPVPDKLTLAPLMVAIRSALKTDDRVRLEAASHQLVNALLGQLETEPVHVVVLDQRPSNEEEELHGLYTWEEGSRAKIEVWMRTAARLQVVAYRTFVRTLLHEVCHHLDFHYFELDDSFHTEGFYSRESALARELLALAPEKRPPPPPKAQLLLPF